VTHRTLWTDTVTKTGTYFLTVKGTFSAPMGFKKFPADTQDLPISIALTGRAWQIMPATSGTVSQSCQSLPPCQRQSANPVSMFRHVSDSQPITASYDVVRDSCQALLRGEDVERSLLILGRGGSLLHFSPHPIPFLSLNSPKASHTEEPTLSWKVDEGM